MIRPRKTNRLAEGRAPLAVLQVLDDAGGVVPVADYKRAVAANCSTASAADDCRKQLLVDGLIEVYVRITPRGREALALKLKQGTPCAKPARTAARKATAPTGAPIDSTPLVRAWMGRP